MSESFFRRWSRRKAEHAQDEDGAALTDSLRPSDSEAEDAPAPDAGPAAASQPALPSMKDVASLAPDADYSAFLARGVDKAVHRAAMKKLFSDPHFNVMDRLDIYIDDYTRPALQHAKSTLDPKPLYKTQEEEDGERRLAEQAYSDNHSDSDNEGGPTDEELRDGSDAGSEDAPLQADAEADAEADADAEAGTHAPDAGDELLSSKSMPPQEAAITSKEFPSP